MKYITEFSTVVEGKVVFFFYILKSLILEKLSHYSQYLIQAATVIYYYRYFYN